MTSIGDAARCPQAAEQLWNATTICLLVHGNNLGEHRNPGRAAWSGEDTATECKCRVDLLIKHWSAAAERLGI